MIRTISVHLYKTVSRFDSLKLRFDGGLSFSGTCEPVRGTAPLGWRPSSFIRPGHPKQDAIFTRSVPIA
jgi:hypothetical protein